MARKKNGTKENPVTTEDFKQALTAIVDADKHPYKIVEAKIKDDFCDYKYERTAGVGANNIVAEKGKAGYIRDSMKDAFAELNIHLAVIDDIFKNADIQVQALEPMIGHQLTTLFAVTGFKLSGDEDNLTVQLIGNKYVSMGGRMELETGKIAIDENSSYKWKNELRAAVIDCTEEVARYHEGNYIPIETEEEKVNPKQLKITDQVEEHDSENSVTETDDLEFSAAKV